MRALRLLTSFCCENENVVRKNFVSKEVSNKEIVLHSHLHKRQRTLDNLMNEGSDEEKYFGLKKINVE